MKALYKFIPIVTILLLCSCASEKKQLTDQDILGSRALYTWLDTYMEMYDSIPTKESFIKWNNAGLEEIALTEMQVPKDKVKQYLADSVFNANWVYTNFYEKNEHIGTDMRSKAVVANYLEHHKDIRFIKTDTSLIVVDSTLFTEKGEVAKIEIPFHKGGDVEDSELMPPPAPQP